MILSMLNKITISRTPFLSVSPVCREYLWCQVISVLQYHFFVECLSSGSLMKLVFVCLARFLVHIPFPTCWNAALLAQLRLNRILPSSAFLASRCFLDFGCIQPNQTYFIAIRDPWSLKKLLKARHCVCYLNLITNCSMQD